MGFIADDGGRSAAGFEGKANDCVVRAIAIATGKLYSEVYSDLFRLAGKTPRNRVAKQVYKAYLAQLGARWIPTMGIGTGCKVHLREGELPLGRLVVATSRHLVAVIDGVIHDIEDPSRDGTRCVYGYWIIDANSIACVDR